MELRVEMTLDELLELGRELAPVDPAAVPLRVAARVADHNRRVNMLEALLRRAHRTLASGGHIEPAFSETIRFAAAALRASRSRLQEDFERP